MNAKFCAQKKPGVLSGYSPSGGGVVVTSVPGFSAYCCSGSTDLNTPTLYTFYKSIPSQSPETLNSVRSRSQRINSRIIISHSNNDRPPNTVCDLCERPRKSASREWLIYSFT